MDDKQKELLKKQTDKMEEADRQNKSLKREAKSIGIDITLPTGEIVEGLMDSAKNQELDAVPIFAETRKGKYRIDEQHFALMFLEVFQKEDHSTGDMSPKFADVSKMLGIPRNTLYHWWNNKEKLQAQQSALMRQGFQYVSTSLMVEMIRMLQALSKVNYETMTEDSRDMRNFISLINTMMNKVRLFSDRSTQNVEHKHSVAMVLPDEE
tara:strand:+ start:900 stop:1526 length:627 start_codon:yes stop_codon:yes gene_type:complete